MDSISLTDKQTARFWSRVDMSGGPDACWLWCSYSLPSGYGRIGFECRSAGWRAHWLSHRLAFFLANGYLTPGLCVLHKCDNPPCCNPLHLWEGTKGDNNRDMAAKGRSGRIVYPDDLVVAIRAALASGGRPRWIAMRFNVRISYVYSLVSGKSKRGLLE